MKRLSDGLLLEAYQKACEFNLSPDFISLIKSEMKQRYLNDKLKCSNTHAQERLRLARLNE